MKVMDEKWEERWWRMCMRSKANGRVLTGVVTIVSCRVFGVRRERQDEESIKDAAPLQLIVV